MVVAREPGATRVGLRVLQSGGNAIDAAVAVGFALAVTHPSAGNLGGGGFMLLRLADGRVTFLDFRERAPRAASRDMYLDANGKVTGDSLVGYRASGVPGTVRGLDYASRKYGKKPWAEVVRPAVELAAKGFPLSYGTAQSLRSSAKSLSRFPDSNRILLGILEGTGFEQAGAASALSTHLMAEAMRRFFADRAAYLGDADFARVPLLGLLDPAYVAKRRASIDPNRATPSSEILAGVFADRESTQTTHYSIADAAGNIAAVTYTLNGSYGSSVTATGLGFLLNNEMDDFAPKPGEANAYGLIQGEANAIQPGKAPLSSMAPTFVLREGRPFLALGSPGGPTIINSVLEVLVNVIDFGMNAQDAVDRPRFHHQWLPDELRVEPGHSPDTVALLEKFGHVVKRVRSQGEVAAIGFDSGWLLGAPDRRTESTAEGY